MSGRSADVLVREIVDEVEVPVSERCSRGLMLAGQGAAVFATGLAMWRGQDRRLPRALESWRWGSLRPMLAAFAAKRGARRLLVRRRLSDVRVSPARA